MDLNKSYNQYEDDVNQTNIQQIDDILKNNKDLRSLSSVKKYILEWTEVSRYLCREENLEKLRTGAILGDLKISKFRSICWSLFFGLLKDDCNLWIEERQRQRLRYKNLKGIYCLNPHTVKCIDDDPLSQAEMSVWNRHFCDQELCAVIKQDVVRTFPGIDFFRKPNIQEIMTSILFCYARENPVMCYRQGMHEILAPILFVIHSDHQAYMHCQELNNTFDPTLSELLNNKYLEDDSYTIFSYIMNEIESYYRINDLIPTSTGYFPSTPNLPTTPDEPQTNSCKIEVVDQLNIIRDQILSKEDLRLHNHLLQLDIPLPLFGIRWLRLLFGREFALQDLLILWDAIFAEGDHLHLTNYVVVAMLVMIREKLLSSDYTSCLTLLMKYPNNVDISLIIKLALHMKNPKMYNRPEGYNPERIIKLNLSTSSTSSLPRNLNAKQSTKKTTKKLDQRRTSVPISINSSNEYRDDKATTAKINGIHTVTARAAIRVAAQSHSIGEPDLGIIDGYLENDPEVSIVPLQYAQSIMAISRLKLIQYLAVLRKHTQDNTIDEIHQALDGIEEICSLLKYSNTNPYNIPAPVEPAFEVDEGPQQQTSKAIITKNNPPTDLNLVLDHQVQLRRRKSIQENKKEIEIEHKEDLGDKRLSTNIREHRYEIPVNSRIADKLFGNLKDIEMRVFEKRRKDEPILSNEDNNMPAVNPCKERCLSLDNN